MSATSQQLPCLTLSARISVSDETQLVGFGGRDSVVHVYPFGDATPIARLEGLRTPVTTVAFSHDQRSVLGGSSDGAVRLWDLTTEQCTCPFPLRHKGAINDAAMHSGERYVATASADSTMRIWDTRLKKSVQSYKYSKSSLSSVQMGPGDLVAVGNVSGSVHVYDLRTSKIFAQLERHAKPIRSISFHPSVFFIVLACDDGTISAWDLEAPASPQFQSAQTSDPIDAVHFCDNSIIAATREKLKIYDTKNLRDAKTVNYSAPWTRVTHLAYMPFLDEVWYVETNATTARTGRMPVIRSPVNVENGNGNGSTVTSGLKENIAPVRTHQPPSIPTSAPPQPREAKVPSAIRIAPPEFREGAKKPKEVTNYVVEKSKPPPLIPKEHTTSSPPGTYRGRELEIPTPVYVDDGLPEDQLVDTLLETSTGNALSLRLAQTKVLRALWPHDQRAVLQHLRQICEDGNGGVIYDFLTIMQQQRMKEKLSTDSMPGLIEVIHHALRSSHDELVLVAVRTLRSVVTKLRAKVTEGQRRARMFQSNGHNDPLGVSSWQESQQKLSECSALVLELSKRRDSIGEEAYQLLSDMPPPLRDTDAIRRN